MISDRRSDLALMYQLFSRVKKGTEELCKAFSTFIKVVLFVSIVTTVSIVTGSFARCQQVKNEME